MARFHILKNGNIAECKADKGTCKLSGEHFASVEEAQAEIDRREAEKYEKPVLDYHKVPDIADKLGLEYIKKAN